MQESLKTTELQFSDLSAAYKGKVRDVYYFGNQLAMVTSDRISAFDVILPKGIPGKGQILNAIAAKNLEDTRHIVPNWLSACPHPNVMFGQRCEPIPLELVIRGYLAGHAWREYSKGERMLCGSPMPEGLKESDAFPEPLITPATKAEEGHDEDITPDEILKRGIVTADEWNQLKAYTRALYAHGQARAKEQGLILVDTKYEFGKVDGKIVLMDEIHTPDSSRYYYLDTYKELQEKGEKQKQLSKEFVREWLMSEGFQGLEGQELPEMTPEVIAAIQNRYLELFEKLMGYRLEIKPNDVADIQKAIEGVLQK